MGRLWCAKDPLIDINGQTIQILLNVQQAHLEKVNGSPSIKVIVPLHSSVQIHPTAGDDESLNGYRILVETEESNLFTNLAHVTAEIPSRGNVSIHLQVWSPMGSEELYEDMGPKRKVSVTVPVPMVAP